MMQSFKTKRQVRCNPLPGSHFRISNYAQTRVSVSLKIMLHQTTRSKSLINTQCMCYKHVNFVQQGSVHHARCCRGFEKKVKDRCAYSFLHYSLQECFLRNWQHGLTNWYARSPAITTWHSDDHLSRRWSWSLATKKKLIKRSSRLQSKSDCTTCYPPLIFLKPKKKAEYILYTSNAVIPLMIFANTMLFGVWWKVN